MVGPVFALLEQGRLGILHLTDEAANSIVKLFAFARENFALRSRETFVSAQFDDVAQVRKAVDHERYHGVEPLLLRAVVRRQLAQPPCLAINDCGSLSVGLQIALITRDDLPA